MYLNLIVNNNYNGQRQRFSFLPDRPYGALMDFFCKLVNYFVIVSCAPQTDINIDRNTLIVFLIDYFSHGRGLFNESLCGEYIRK